VKIQIRLTDALEDYITNVSLREPNLLRELRDKTGGLPERERIMQISPEQGQFLHLLVRAVGAKRALEVGTFTGYSLLCTALALPADGTVVACEISKEWAAIALEYCQRAGVADKVDLRIGDARETLAGLVEREGLAASFDFVFIDADKEGYEAYYEAALTLLRSGGLIVVDNVLWHGDVVNDTVQDGETRALRTFNAKLHHDERVDLSLIPFADGLTFALKR
jgi:predicted O-methyltransferase YrrM